MSITTRLSSSSLSSLLLSMRLLLRLLLVSVAVLFHHQQRYLFVDAHWPHDTIDALAVSSDGGRSAAYVSVRSSLMETTDMGRTWRYIRALPGEPNRPYFALSPYEDQTLYVYNSFGTTMFRSNNLIEWEILNDGVAGTSNDIVDPCGVKYYGKTKRRTTFTIGGYALIAGNGGVLYKEVPTDTTTTQQFAAGAGSGTTFIPISSYDFGSNTCPALSGAPNSDVVYAGATDGGLVRSIDGGTSWTLVFAITENANVDTSVFDGGDATTVVDLLAISENEVLVMTTSRVCLYYYSSNECVDMMLPETTTFDRVRDTNSSTPIDMTYINGTLMVARANSYALYYTTDLGSTWNIRNQLNGDFPNPGHSGTDAWDFDGSEEFTHVDGYYVGSWIGVYSSSDNGNTWAYGDTIRNAIVNFDIIKSGSDDDDDDDVTVVACVYSGGCFLGSESNLTSYPFGNGYYNALHLSPIYEEDGIGFKNTRSQLRRTDTTGSNQIVELPRLLDGVDKISIKTVLFSPSYATDSTIFVAGYNLGVLVSYNNGISFTQLFNADGYQGVTRLVLSPTFTTDGIMACLVDREYDGSGRRYVNNIYIYISNDSGANWWRVTDDLIPWCDLIIINTLLVDASNNEGTTTPSTSDLSSSIGPAVILAINGKDRKLYAHSTDPSTAGTSLTWLRDSHFERVRPEGYSYDGTAVTPSNYDGGITLAAAWIQGDIMFGNIAPYNNNTDIADNNNQYIFMNYYFSQPNPWNEEYTDRFPTVYGRIPPSVSDGFGRYLSPKVIFSPDYANDNTIYAASMFDIFKSTNQGLTWTKIYSFQEQQQDDNDDNDDEGPLVEEEPTTTTQPTPTTTIQLTEGPSPAPTTIAPILEPTPEPSEKEPPIGPADSPLDPSQNQKPLDGSNAERHISRGTLVTCLSICLMTCCIIQGWFGL